MANFEEPANQKLPMELRTQMDFKGINIETRATLKLMAANRGISLHQLLDEMVEEAFKKEQYTLVGPWLPANFPTKCENYQRLKCESLVHHGKEWCVRRISHPDSNLGGMP